MSVNADLNKSVKIVRTNGVVDMKAIAEDKKHYADRQDEEEKGWEM